MFDTVKSDLYQLFRSKIFWWTEILLFIYSQTLVFFRTSNDVDMSVMMDGQVKFQMSTGSWTGAEALMKSSFNSNSILFFTLILALLLLGGDLMNKRYKNSLSKGLSRGQFFLSKNVTIALLSLINLVLFYGLVFVESSLLNGIGQVSASFFFSFLLTLLAQLVVTIAVVQLVNLFSYWTHSPIPGLVGFIIFTASLTTPARLLPNNAFFNFINIEFPMAKAADVTTSLFFIVFMIAQAAIFGWIALKIFRKQDL
ncbi:hypothetical protein [Streptococcus oricebi]|uniref:ABC-2 family transporter protein n=1 Tax=Streptococcus oricebi TaxID=1547447 RepID=A0ABS5B507_9STRE|nr:hypothetical protein [Streptococcus oricebi]MBP2623074.1 hypothetical protein [Streptococcus oricebi]